MFTLRSLAISLSLALSAGAASAAPSITIDSTAGPFSFDVAYVCDIGDVCNGGIGSGGTNHTSVNLLFESAWSFTGVSDSGSNRTWTFEIAMANASDGASRWTAFGFATDPNLVSRSLTDNGDNDWSVNGGFIPGFNSIETCVFDAGNCQAAGGGPSQGLSMGEVDTIILALTTGLSSMLTLSDFAAKAASIAGGGSADSLQFAGDVTVAPVPVPAAAPLLLAALAGLAFASRRRRAA